MPFQHARSGGVCTGASAVRRTLRPSADDRLPTRAARAALLRRRFFMRVRRSASLLLGRNRNEALHFLLRHHERTIQRVEPLYHARRSRRMSPKMPVNNAMNPTVRPVTRLALQPAFMGSNGHAQGARPSRPAGYRGRYAVS